MPDSLLNGRMKLGRFLGIDLFVHWSFAIVIAYVAFFSRQLGLSGIAFAVAQLLGVFLCVTLHEYGHAMAARRFGIPTADITLLPIGGVARLTHMPRVPWQETIVAIAGPAVNVAIVAVLLLAFFVTDKVNLVVETLRYFVTPSLGFQPNEQTSETIDHLFSGPSFEGFAIIMLFVNSMLVLFNMIPAFPMDGGRVFRSVLAMAIDYRRATRIASTVGLACATVMAMIALSADPPRWMPVMIATFVGYAGLAEARQVDVTESIRGLTVGDVMIRSTDSLPMDMPLGTIIQRWQTTLTPSLPVTSIVGTVVGMLSLRDVRRAVERRIDLQTPAGQLIDHDDPVSPVYVHDALEVVLRQGNRRRRFIPVVGESDQLCGIVDLETMLPRGDLNRSVKPTPVENDSRFDQTT